MNSRIAIAITALVVFGLFLANDHASVTAQQESVAPSQTASLMTKKLAEAQALLTALALSDFERPLPGRIAGNVGPC